MPQPSRIPTIVAGRRTPVGTRGHALADADVTALAAPVLAALAAELTGPVDQVILGNCLGPGGNPARVAALAAGLAAPAWTVDQQCGSGLAAVIAAAAAIRAGDADAVLTGGVESASTTPIRTWRDSGLPYDRAPFAPAGFADPDMGEAADALARLRGIGRQRQDEYAARSHALTWESVRTGRFDAELVPVNGVRTDDRPRPGMSAQRLARLRPAFGPEGTSTAGNSCGISDGAAAVAVVAGSGTGPGLQILSTATVTGDPALPGALAAPAVRAVLNRCEIPLTAADLGAVEVTEAFASIPLALIDDLGLAPESVCAEGGAIALGHPWGASGAILLLRLWHRMVVADGPEFGVAVCAVGGGQGAAVLVRRTGS